MLATTLTRCERIAATEKWRVFCVRCVLDLGTFTGDGLRDAVQYNQNRGGILCVRCRENSCRDCGVEVDMEARMPQLEDRLCWFCKMDVEIDERLAEVDRLAEEDEILYLVPHNSKTEYLKNLSLPGDLQFFTLPSKEKNGGRDD